MNIGGVVFPLEQQSRDEASVVYHAQYDTEGVPHTKSGDRQPVQVSIEVGWHTLTSRLTQRFVRTDMLSPKPSEIQMFGMLLLN